MEDAQLKQWQLAGTRVRDRLKIHETRCLTLWGTSLAGKKIEEKKKMRCSYISSKSDATANLHGSSLQHDLSSPFAWMQVG